MAEKKPIDSILGKAKTTVTTTFAESERKKGGRPKSLKVNMPKRIVLLRTLALVNFLLLNQLQIVMA